MKQGRSRFLANQGRQPFYLALLLNQDFITVSHTANQELLFDKGFPPEVKSALLPFFFQKYGGNSFHTKKPDPHGIQSLIAEASAIAGSTVTSAETIMIGDTDIDVLTARNCGARSIGCTFGLKPHSLVDAPPDHLAYTPTDWVQILDIAATS